MRDTSQGRGRWIAPHGKWYPPESYPTDTSCAPGFTVANFPHAIFYSVAVAAPQRGALPDPMAELEVDNLSIALTMGN